MTARGCRAAAALQSCASEPVGRVHRAAAAGRQAALALAASRHGPSHLVLAPSAVTGRELRSYDAPAENVLDFR